jgi:ubiquinone biosynthesis protein Coq4
VAAARDQYFRTNGFSAAAYTDRWVKLKLGPLTLAFPNSAARKAAVKLHDLHHIATGYATTWRGESEIAAWELAAGCGRYWAAWVLNLGALGIGMLIAPLRTARAFARGRRSKSLYHRAFGDDLLVKTVGDLRRDLGLSVLPG